MKFADITNDIAFRKIFGNENKTKALVSFLNAVIELPGNGKIVDVEITNPYQLPKLSGGRSTIVDVKAKDKTGNTFIVEMQVAELDFFHKRILYYTSQSYSAQIDSGHKYDRLKPVYFIGILEFEIGNNPNYFSRHKVLDVETNEQVIQDVEFNFLELPKFNKTLEQLTTSIDQWTYFIKNAENLNVIPENISDEGLKEAYTEADKHNWTKLELEDYERAAIKETDERLKWEFLERKAKRLAEENAKRFVEENAKRFAEEKEKEIKTETAKRLKAKGMDIVFIMEITGLTGDEIELL